MIHFIQATYWRMCKSCVTYLLTYLLISADVPATWELRVLDASSISVSVHQHQMCHLSYRTLLHFVQSLLKTQISQFWLLHLHCNNKFQYHLPFLIMLPKPKATTIDVANVQNVLHNLWKERVLLRSFQYYFWRTLANVNFVIYPLLSQILLVLIIKSATCLFSFATCFFSFDTWNLILHVWLAVLEYWSAHDIWYLNCV